MPAVRTAAAVRVAVPAVLPVATPAVRVAAPAVPPAATPAVMDGTAGQTAPGAACDGTRQLDSRPGTDAEALAGLPRAYRSWASGVLRVGAALLFIVVAGMVLRAVPEPEDATRATGGGPVESSGGASEAAGGTAGSGATEAQRHPGPRAASGLRVVVDAPAGVRVASVTSSVSLHAEVNDERGGDPGDVDVTWQISSTETGRTVFRGRGADLGMPPGALPEGIYHVIVRALDGQREATGLGVLVITGDRA